MRMISNFCYPFLFTGFWWFLFLSSASHITLLFWINWLQAFGRLAFMGLEDPNAQAREVCALMCHVNLAWTVFPVSASMVERMARCWRKSKISVFANSELDAGRLVYGDRSDAVAATANDVVDPGCSCSGNWAWRNPFDLSENHSWKSRKKAHVAFSLEWICIAAASLLLLP